jgi:hypothetical protein
MNYRRRLVQAPFRKFFHLGLCRQDLDFFAACRVKSFGFCSFASLRFRRRRFSTWAQPARQDFIHQSQTRAKSAAAQSSSLWNTEPKPRRQAPGQCLAAARPILGSECAPCREPRPSCCWSVKVVCLPASTWMGVRSSPLNPLISNLPSSLRLMLAMAPSAPRTGRSCRPVCLRGPEAPTGG